MRGEHNMCVVIVCPLRKRSTKKRKICQEDRRQIPNFVLSSKMRKQRKLERLMDEIIEENREALEELAQ